MLRVGPLDCGRSTTAMYNNSPNADFTKRTIEQVSLQAGSFTPDALLHVCRLRLYVNLLRSPDDLLPGAIHDNYLACGSCGEKAWFGCVRNALDWLVATVGLFPEAQGLRDLQPQELFQAHVGLADGLHRALRSALKAHLLHLQMLVDLTETHDKISLTLSQAGWSCPQAGGEKLQHLKYRCPDCKATFRGEAHLATHRQRTHGTLVAARSFVLNSCCPACKRISTPDQEPSSMFNTSLPSVCHGCWRTELLFQRILRDPLMPKMLRILELNVDQAYVLAAHACQLTLLDHSLLQLLNQPHGYPPRPVELCGYDPIGLEQHIFLDKWSSYDAGPWTTLPVVWGIFAAELKDAYKNCPLSSLESFKSEVCDLVEAVSWRQDDFEVVNVINEQLYEIAKAFYVQQIPRVLPETRFDRLQRMEAQFGSLPAWMGHRDHTQRDTTDGGEERLHIPQKLAALEQGWRSEVALWTSPTESVARPFFKECFYLVFYSGHRRDGDIATQICRLSPDAPRVLLYPICLDLCIDQVRGDLLCPVQQRLWATRMKERKVIGFHASPPCETYADARWLPPPGDAVRTTSLEDMGISLGATCPGSG